MDGLRDGEDMSTLTADQVSQIASAIEQAFEIVAGDPVTHVDGSGVQTSLVMIQFDTTVLVDRQERGLEIGSDGMLSHGVRELVFLKSDLAAASVTIGPTSYFLIGTERWDLIEDAAIQEATVPLAGIQNLLIVQVRRATELNTSEVAAEAIWQP